LAISGRDIRGSHQELALRYLGAGVGVKHFPLKKWVAKCIPPPTPTKKKKN